MYLFCYLVVSLKLIFDTPGNILVTSLKYILSTGKMFKILNIEKRNATKFSLAENVFLLLLLLLLLALPLPQQKIYNKCTCIYYFQFERWCFNEHGILQLSQSLTYMFAAPFIVSWYLLFIFKWYASVYLLYYILSY